MEEHMKLDRSTRILLNLVLVLVAAVLVKAFISIPFNLYAAENPEYKVIKYNKTEFNWNAEGLSRFLNANAKSGWKYHSMHWGEASGQIYGIFER